MDPLLPQF